MLLFVSFLHIYVCIMCVSVCKYERECSITYGNISPIFFIGLRYEGNVWYEFVHHHSSTTATNEKKTKKHLKGKIANETQYAS